MEILYIDGERRREREKAETLKPRERGLFDVEPQEEE